MGKILAVIALGIGAMLALIAIFALTSQSFAVSLTALAISSMLIYPSLKTLGVLTPSGVKSASASKPHPRGLICKNCGSVNATKMTDDGDGRSFLIFVLLLFCAILPGLLYWGIRKKKKSYLICSSCKSTDLFDIKSPMGQKIYIAYHATKTQN